MFRRLDKVFKSLVLFCAFSLAFTTMTQKAHALVVLPVVAIGLVHIIVALAGFLIVPTTFVVKIVTKHKILKSILIALGIIAGLVALVLIALKLYFVLSTRV